MYYNYDQIKELKAQSTRLMRMADRRAIVTGLYFGEPFKGQVVSSRQITVRPFPEQVKIETAPGTALMGENRDRHGILINAQDIIEGTHALHEVTDETQ
jgi:hypothetical protein